MSKQTVEEAMSAFAKERGIVNETDGMYCRGYSHGFKDAAVWQRGEQGIDWIRVTDGLPEQKDEEIHCTVVVTDGRYIRATAYWFESKTFAVEFVVQHWAYVNLPKTDK